MEIKYIDKEYIGKYTVKTLYNNTMYFTNALYHLHKDIYFKHYDNNTIYEYQGCIKENDYRELFQFINLHLKYNNWQFLKVEFHYKGTPNVNGWIDTKLHINPIYMKINYNSIWSKYIKWKLVQL